MSKRKLSLTSTFPNESKHRMRNLEGFPVDYPDSYKGDFPAYKQPTEITSYSIDHNRQVWFDDRELKYYYPPNGNDLYVGFDKFIKRDESFPEHIDTLLDALTDIKQKSSNPQLTKADIITWRGIMTKIMCTPTTRNEGWILRATRYENTIYIDEKTVEEKKNREANAPIKEQMQCYGGYRFETLCTLSKPPSRVKKGDPELLQRLNESADTNIQYCVVVKTKLGRNSLIMGAEVDCSRDVKPVDEKADPLGNYVELKTSRLIENNRHQTSFERFKLKKFWAQSFLVGVPRVICGFRDEQGLVQDIKEFKTMEIPRIVRNKPGMWEPVVCLRFADEFLEWLQTVVVDDDPMVTYLVEWKAPWKEITIVKEVQPQPFITQRYIDGEISNAIGGPRVSRKTAE
ncbi:RAI1 like PD-XK nuclease-domain-containing protein [Phycomyces nitens]|nr:RAI1 like PD-XK nuclease-domain-containing protein [Phycomyces nitens]